MKSTGIRIPESLESFVNRVDDVSTSELARKGIENEMIRRCAGCCANCGELVFIGDGHTNVRSETPLGQTADPGVEIEEYDLCKGCGDVVYESVRTGEEHDLEFDFLKMVGAFNYQATRHALVDAQPDSPWIGMFPTNFSTNSTSFMDGSPTKDQILAYHLTWAGWLMNAENTASESLDAQYTFTPETILRNADKQTIHSMYEIIPIDNLKSKGIIPDTAEEAMEI